MKHPLQRQLNTHKCFKIIQITETLDIDIRGIYLYLHPYIGCELSIVSSG